MNRRSFLVATSSLALGQLLAACSGQNSSTLSVRLLKNSVPAQLVNQFKKQLNQAGIKNARLDFNPEAQLQTLFLQLQAWKRANGQPPDKPLLPLPFLNNRSQSTVPDLMTLGDYWLSKAIQQRLIQPLELGDVPTWKSLAPSWKMLVTRNASGAADPQGKVWAAPYRWGTTAIAYRMDQFQTLGWQPTDWADLWRPELKHLICLPDHPREVIGLTLKKLGKSYNTLDLDTVASLDAELRALHQQVKLYSSSSYLEPLVLGSAWVAVGSSRDILTLMQQNSKIGAIIPRSGTALWADLWVRPATSSPQDPSLVAKWIDFCWQSTAATDLSQLSKGASPIFMNAAPTTQATAPPTLLQGNSLLLPTAETLQRSEFIEPLSGATADQYRSLWVKIRRSS